MYCKVVLSPELGVSVEQFVALWNGFPESSQIAKAEIASEQTSETFGIDLSTVQQGLILLTGFVGGILVDTLRNLIQEQLTSYLQKRLKRVKEPKVKVSAIRQPDGGYLLVVEKEE